MTIPTGHDSPRLAEGSGPAGSSPAVWAHEVAVKYRLPHESLSGLKESLVRWVQGRLRYRDFWALKGVSFELRPGEVGGIVGSNGAGKSTLLKVIARVMRPTAGRVIVRGGIAPLLELGAGFHLELTGRENIFLNSAMLGRSRAVTRSLYREIVDFAELWDFIDAPLRTYSSGMIARLGFSVATASPAEILLIDEVLSVGDASFREKSNARIRAFQNAGASILLVSHNLASVEEMCTWAMWLEGGKIRTLGEPGRVVAEYRRKEKP